MSRLFGPDVYYDEWFARAAAKTYVSCEELVDRMEDHYPDDAQANVSNAPSFRAYSPSGRRPPEFDAASLWLGYEGPQGLRRCRERSGRLGSGGKTVSSARPRPTILQSFGGKEAVRLSRCRFSDD
jgi:glutaconate CoA-transferase subunit A